MSVSCGRIAKSFFVALLNDEWKESLTCFFVCLFQRRKSKEQFGINLATLIFTSMEIIGLKRRLEHDIFACMCGL